MYSQRIYFLLFLNIFWILCFSTSAKKRDVEYNVTDDSYEDLANSGEISDLELPVPSSFETILNTEEIYEENEHFLDKLPTPKEIVFPIQLRKNARMLGISTREPHKHRPQHFHHTSFQISMFGHRIKVRLELTKELLSKGLQQKRSVDEKTQVITERQTENCYYQGAVRRMPDSFVAMSTCDGLRGIIQMGNESYILAPLKQYDIGNDTHHPHVVYRSRPTATKQSCANAHRGMWKPFQDLHRGEFLRKTKIMKSRRSERNIVTETKTLDLALVLDLAAFEKLNGTFDSAVEYGLQIGNLLNFFYKEFKINILMVYVEVWDLVELFKVTPNARETLHEALAYSLKGLRTVNYDAVQFILGDTEEAQNSGMAIPDSICTKRGLGISYVDELLDIHKVAAQVAHMLAHTLGVHHDEDGDCTCQGGKGCIMQEKDEGLPQYLQYPFSSCTSEDLETSFMAGLGSCLLKKPLEVTYEQTCGNGKLERGEECDCGSPRECAYRDPCCDPETCLLIPRATCQFGPCCHNCTLLPKSHVCRSPFTECDVPEYCDGISQECPANVLVQDGQSCRNGDSFCYKGLCTTLDDQCFAIWGDGATPADDKCYETFNPTGNFNGHCGQNSQSREYLKCHEDNIKCGLLHCSGGLDKPRIGPEKTYTTTYVSSDGSEFQCKILNGVAHPDLPQLGMIEDGTKCGPANVCLNKTCIPVDRLIHATCPVGPNNETCSGNGKCTSHITCYCKDEYEGIDCSIKKNLTTLGIINTTPLVVSIEENVNYEIIKTAMEKSSTTLSTTAAGAPVMRKEASTLWLIIVLASVAGGSLLILGFAMLCYRRRSPRRLKKKAQKKKLSQMWGAGSVKSLGSGSEDNNSTRLISFGKMPSYRADKMKELQRALRKSVGGMSETGSEHSAKSTESTEVKMSQTLPLAKPPERGILKKYPRSAENLRRPMPARIQPSESESGTGSELDMTIELENENLLSRANAGIAQPSPLARQTSPKTPLSTQGNRRSFGGLSPIEREGQHLIPQDEVPTQEADENGSDEEYVFDDESCSECSCEKKEIPLSDFENSEEEKEELENELTESDGEEQAQGETSPRGSHSSTEGVGGPKDKNKAVKLKNIDDLLRQLDAQMLNLKKQQQQEKEKRISPSNSDDTRLSETEADRHYPRHSYYRQSDEGLNPPVSPATCGTPTEQRHLSLYSPTDSPYTTKQKNRSSYSPDRGSVTSPLSPKHLVHKGPKRSSYSPLQSPDHTFNHPLGSPKYENLAQRRRSREKLNHGSSPKASLPPTAKHSRPVSFGTRGPPRVPTPPEQYSKRTFEPASPGRPQNLATRIPSPIRQGAKTRQSPTRGGNPSYAIPRITSPTHKNSSNHQSPIATPQQHSPVYPGSPKRTSPELLKQGKSSPPNAIPYRGAKNGSIPGSPPTTRHKPGGDSASGYSTPEPPQRNPLKLIHPLLDGYPVKRNSLTGDGHSTSEGYHSDRADTDDAIVVREIPVLKPDDPQLSNSSVMHRRDSYTKATGSNESLNDSINL